MKDLKENLKKIIAAEVSRQFTVLRSEMLLEIGRMEQRITSKLLSEGRGDITSDTTHKSIKANIDAHNRKPTVLEMLTGNITPFDEVDGASESVDLSGFIPDMSVQNKPFEIPDNTPVPRLFESSTISGTDGGVVNVNNEQTKKVLKTIGMTNFRDKIKAMEKHAKRR